MVRLSFRKASWYITDVISSINIVKHCLLSIYSSNNQSLLAIRISVCSALSFVSHQGSYFWESELWATWEWSTGHWSQSSCGFRFSCPSIPTQLLRVISTLFSAPDLFLWWFTMLSPQIPTDCYPHAWPQYCPPAVDTLLLPPHAPPCFYCHPHFFFLL